MALDFADVAVDRIINGIVFTAKKIRSTAAQMKVNKVQSKQLAERVATMTTLLQGADMSKLTNPGMQAALERFDQFLKECEQFLETFTKAGWIARVRAHSNHAQKFEELNTNLDRHRQDLSFGLQIHMVHRNLAEEKIAAQNDLEEINQIIRASQVGVLSNPSVQPPVNTFSRSRPTGPTGGTNVTRPTGPVGDKPPGRAQPPNLDKNYLMSPQFFRPLSHLHHKPYYNSQRQQHRTRANSFQPQQPFPVRPSWHNSALSSQQAGYRQRMQYPYALNQVYS